MGISQHSILICDKGGQPHHWASVEDGIVLRVKNLLSYELGSISTYYGGTSRMTGERSHIDVGSVVFLKEILKYDARVPPLTNENLFIRDMHICLYCGRHYPASKLSRDHIIPTSRGGKNVWNNVVAACKSCNHAKDDMTPEEAGLKLLAIPYVPSHAERLLMQNRRVLFDQTEYLKGFLPEHSRILQAPHILGLQ